MFSYKKQISSLLLYMSNHLTYHHQTK